MPTTESQKKASKKYYEANKDKCKELNKKWREENRERFNELCLKHHHKTTVERKLKRLDKMIAHKQELLELYQQSRSPDSPITTDDESI